MGSCRNWLDMPGHVFEDLHFVNNSNTSVCFYPYSLSWATVKYGTFYPDTLLRKGYKILKRYDLSIDDLDSLNWTITYP